MAVVNYPVGNATAQGRAYFETTATSATMQEYAVPESQPVDQATMRECYSYLRGGCDAADLMANWTSKGGVDCAGAFKVVNTRPGVMGQWSSIVNVRIAPSFREGVARYRRIGG